MSYAILIVEDETNLARNIKIYLERAGYEALIAEDGESALTEFDGFNPDLTLLDLRLPGIGGLEVLARARQRYPEAKIIIMTAHGDVETAVQAMKAGAYDYLSKPIVLSELLRVVERTINAERTEGQLSYYRRRYRSEGRLDLMIGESRAMTLLKERIRRLVEAGNQVQEGVPAPVLITGETGTGKELIARAIHFEGRRSELPFVEINCSALPADLVEAELFGHERGAFTDAKEHKIGLFEAADKGSIFLDEIGEMRIETQVKLLKVIEDQKVRRIGSIRERQVNVQVIAATNREIEKMIADKIFRADLFYRLSIAAIEAPPLRERGNDILLLADHFISQLARHYQRAPPRLSPEANDLLMAHSWSGNVRELRNVIEQAILFCPSAVIPPESLSLPRLNTRVPIDPPSAQTDVETLVLPAEGIELEEVERRLLIQALTQTNWNVSSAARLLNLSRDTLRYRIEKFDLSPPN